MTTSPPPGPPGPPPGYPPPGYPSAGAPPPGYPPPGYPLAGRRRRGRLVVGIAAAALAVAVAVAVAVVVRRDSGSDKASSSGASSSASVSSAAAALSDDDEAALAVGQEFVREFNTFGRSDLRGGAMAAYLKRVHPLVTPALARRIDEDIGETEFMVRGGGSREALGCLSAIETKSADRDSILASCEVDGHEAGRAVRPAVARWRLVEVRVGGAWLVDGYRSAEDEEFHAPKPTALGGAADQAVVAASKALPEVWSYDYRTLSRWPSVAGRHVTPELRAGFSKWLADITPKATSTKTVVTVRMVGLGVYSLAPDQVEIYAFADQTARSTEWKGPTHYPYVVLLTMRPSGSTWLLDNIVRE